MNKSKWMSMAAVLTLSASLAVAAPHEGKGGRHHGRGGEFGARFAEKLNLTDAQKQQMRDLQRDFRQSNKAFFEQARETRRQLREAKQSGDNARLEELKATAQSQHQRMRQLRTEERDRIVSILTPEQRTQLEAMKAERQARRAQRNGGK